MGGTMPECGEGHQEDPSATQMGLLGTGTGQEHDMFSLRYHF